MCWELRFRGDPQWHAGVDPFSVETCLCAYALKQTYVHSRMKPALRCVFRAVGSVACLEWGRWIKDQTLNASANALRLLLFETVSAKEAKN